MHTSLVTSSVGPRARIWRWFVEQRRRQHTVEGFQARYIAAHLAWTALLLFGFATLLIAPLYYGLYEDGSPGQLRAAAVLAHFYDRLLPALVALATGLTVIVVALSHRVAGPLYRFRIVFEAVCDGQLGVSARLRKDDYPQQEGEALARMLAMLRQHVGAAQAATREAVMAGSPDEMREAVVRAEAALAVFTLAPPPDHVSAPSSHHKGHGTSPHS